MTQPLIAGPAGDDPTGSQPGGEREKPGTENKHRQSAIPDQDDCLRAIAQLPGLVAMQMLKPAQANSMLASYREILQHHERSKSQPGRGALADADVLELMRKDASILNMLAPLLTEEQLAMVLQGGKGGTSGTS